jgi:alpha,alpha-trehalose phosphorylase
LSFWPRRAPEDNAILRFPVKYRGQMLEVEIGVEKVEYTLREGESLVICHESEKIQLTRQSPVALRPVSKRVREEQTSADPRSNATGRLG